MRNGLDHKCINECDGKYREFPDRKKKCNLTGMIFRRRVVLAFEGGGRGGIFHLDPVISRLWLLMMLYYEVLLTRTTNPNINNKTSNSKTIQQAR